MKRINSQKKKVYYSNNLNQTRYGKALNSNASASRNGFDQACDFYLRIND